MGGDEGVRVMMAGVALARHRHEGLRFTLFGDEHVRQYEATGGKVGHDWNNTSCLVLHTTGRKSGGIADRT